MAIRFLDELPDPQAMTQPAQMGMRAEPLTKPISAHTTGTIRFLDDLPDPAPTPQGPPATRLTLTNQGGPVHWAQMDAAGTEYLPARPNVALPPMNLAGPQGPQAPAAPDILPSRPMPTAYNWDTDAAALAAEYEQEYRKAKDTKALDAYVAGKWQNLARAYLDTPAGQQLVQQKLALLGNALAMSPGDPVAAAQEGLLPSVIQSLQKESPENTARAQRNWTQEFQQAAKKQAADQTVSRHQYPGNDTPAMAQARAQALRLAADYIEQLGIADDPKAAEPRRAIYSAYLMAAGLPGMAGKALTPQELQQQAQAFLGRMSGFENFRAATAAGMANSMSGLAGWAGPEFGQRVRANIEQGYVHDPSTASGVAGALAGQAIGAAPLILAGAPQAGALGKGVLAGAPWTFGANAAGNTAIEAQDLADAGIPQPAAQRALAAMTAFAVGVAGGKLNVGYLQQVGGPQATALAGQSMAQTLATPAGKLALRDVLAQVAVGGAKDMGVQIGLAQGQQLANNFISREMLGNPNVEPTSGMVQAGASGAIMGLMTSALRGLGAVQNYRRIQREATAAADPNAPDPLLSYVMQHWDNPPNEDAQAVRTALENGFAQNKREVLAQFIQATGDSFDQLRQRVFTPEQIVQISAGKGADVVPLLERIGVIRKANGGYQLNEDYFGPQPSPAPAQSARSGTAARPAAEGEANGQGTAPQGDQGGGGSSSTGRSGIADDGGGGTLARFNPDTLALGDEQLAAAAGIQPRAGARATGAGVAIPDAQGVGAAGTGGGPLGPGDAAAGRPGVPSPLVPPVVVSPDPAREGTGAVGGPGDAALAPVQPVAAGVPENSGQGAVVLPAAIPGEPGAAPDRPGAPGGEALPAVPQTGVQPQGGAGSGEGGGLPAGPGRGGPVAAGAEGAAPAAGGVGGKPKDEGGRMKEEGGSQAQPWEMTRKEYAQDAMRRYARKMRRPVAASVVEGVGAAARNQHEQMVTRAVAEGLPVPPEVLADYPDLKGGPHGQEVQVRQEGQVAQVPPAGAPVKSGLTGAPAANPSETPNGSTPAPAPTVKENLTVPPAASVPVALSAIPDAAGLAKMKLPEMRDLAAAHGIDPQQKRADLRKALDDKRQSLNTEQTEGAEKTGAMPQGVDLGNVAESASSAGVSPGEVRPAAGTVAGSAGGTLGIPKVPAGTAHEPYRRLTPGPLSPEREALSKAVEAAGAKEAELRQRSTESKAADQAWRDASTEYHRLADELKAQQEEDKAAPELEQFTQQLKAVEGGPEDTQLWALPGKESQIAAAGKAMEKLAGPQKHGTAPVRPAADRYGKSAEVGKGLRAEVRSRAQLFALLNESTADQAGRYAANGIGVDKEGARISSTDGVRMHSIEAVGAGPLSAGANGAGFGTAPGVYLVGKHGELTAITNPGGEAWDVAKAFPPVDDVLKLHDPQVEIPRYSIPDLYRVAAQASAIAPEAPGAGRGSAAVLWHYNPSAEGSAGQIGMAVSNPEAGYAVVGAEPAANAVDLGGINARHLMDALDFLQATTGNSEAGLQWESPKKPVILTASGRGVRATAVVMPFGTEKTSAQVRQKVNERSAAVTGPADLERATQPSAGDLEENAQGGVWFDPTPPEAAQNHYRPLLEQPAPWDQGKPISAPQVLESLQKVLEDGLGRSVPMRQGGTGRAKNLGHYDTRDMVIRLREANSIPTAIHEIGHAVEYLLYGEVKGTPWKLANGLTHAMQQELAALGKDLYGDRNPNGGYKREGWAELVRFWMMDSTEHLQQRAPALMKWFAEKFLPANPELAAAMGSAKKDVMHWYDQGAQARAGASIKPEALLEVPKVSFAGLRYVGNEVARALIEEFWPLREFAQEAEARLGRPLSVAESPYGAASSLRMTHSAILDQWVNHTMTDFAGNPAGPALKDVVAIIRKKGRVAFTKYLWARRALRLWEGNATHPPRNPGMAKSDAEALIKQYGTPEFDMAAGMFYQWWDGVMNYVAQASPEFASVVESIRKGDVGDYLPLLREFQEMNDHPGVRRPGGVLGNSPAKKLHGSGRRVLDPFAMVVRKADQWIRAAQHRYVLDQILKLHKAVPGLGEWVTEVPKDMVAQRYPASQLVEQLEKAGLLDPSVFEGKSAAELEQAAITMFAPAHLPRGKHDVPWVAVREEGKTKWYEVHPKLYDALVGMNSIEFPQSLRWAMVVGRAPARMWREGTTGLSVGWGLIRNPTRDIQTLATRSDTSATLPELTRFWAEGVKEAAAATMGSGSQEWMNLFERLGMEMAQPLGIDRFSRQQALNRLFRKHGLKPMSWAGDGYDWYRAVIQFPEAAPRIAEMKALANDIGYTPGQPLTVEQAMALRLAGKRVTVDFTAGGWLGRFLNPFIPFFNASIQGVRGAARAIRKNPLRYFLRALAIGGTLTLVSWFLNKDKKWYQDMPAGQRIWYWNFQVGNQVLEIPREQEMNAAVCMPLEHALNAWYKKDPREAEYFAWNLLNQLAPPGVPTALNLYGEQITGRRNVLGREIVPPYQQMKPAEEQYGPGTSEVAKRAGSAVRYSPAKIDAAIRSGFGRIGSDASHLPDAWLSGKEKPDHEGDPAALPVVGMLFRPGGAEGMPFSSKAVQEYYDIKHRWGPYEQSDDPTKARTATRVVGALGDLSRELDQYQAATTREERNALKLKIVQKAEDGVDRAKLALYLEQKRAASPEWMQAATQGGWRAAQELERKWEAEYRGGK